jgi:FKBP-type peptidyl-prolyl cis-trans isomerase FkpA/FKBP-type peptidyl-prolyl cis-trans isomerase FklB
MRIAIPSALGVLSLFAAQAISAAPEPKTEEQKTLYALGLAVSGGLAPFKLSEAELEMVEAGLADGVLNRKRKVDMEAYLPKVQELQRTRLALAADAGKKAARTYLDKAAKEKGVTTTASGLLYSTIKPGAGASPKATDAVTVHYHGTLTNGAVFDSSVQRGQPATFNLNQVIPCWTEGLQRMKVGEKARLVCPSSLAYGDQGRPPQIQPGATLIFEVELLDIAKQ